MRVAMSIIKNLIHLTFFKCRLNLLYPCSLRNLCSLVVVLLRFSLDCGFAVCVNAYFDLEMCARACARMWVSSVERDNFKSKQT